MTSGTSPLSFVTCASTTPHSNQPARLTLFNARLGTPGHRNQELPERRGWAQYWNCTVRDRMGRRRSSRRLASGGMGPMHRRTTR